MFVKAYYWADFQADLNVQISYQQFYGRAEQNGTSLEFIAWSVYKLRELHIHE